MKFAPCDNFKQLKAEFKPSETYNKGGFYSHSLFICQSQLLHLDFIDSVSSCELNGYCVMLEYAKKLLKTRKPDVGEGITRPHHMLLEFSVVLHII